VLLDGCIRIFRFYDVGEAFDLDKARESVGARGDSIKPDFPRRTPIYVRFESAPVAEYGEPITLHTGERAARTIKYYAYAIVEIQLEVKFTGGWDELLSQASRWMDFLQAQNRYFLKPAIQPSKTGRLLCSTMVKEIPMPEPGRAYVTFPNASKCVSPREILSLTFVPSRNDATVTAKHPNRLRSLVCPEICLSD
jgi:hypothetical protein